jgi:hypothetical protein
MCRWALDPGRGKLNNWRTPKGEFPPVNAFRSATMYDGKTQFLIENPINCYLINSPMLPGMKKNARQVDGPLHPEQDAG